MVGVDNQHAWFVSFGFLFVRVGCNQLIYYTSYRNRLEILLLHWCWWESVGYGFVICIVLFWLKPVACDWDALCDPGFDLNSRCGQCGGDNAWAWIISCGVVCIRAGCSWLNYSPWPRIGLGFLLWPRWRWENFWPGRFLIGFLYQMWLQLVDFISMTWVSIGICGQGGGENLWPEIFPIAFV